MPEVAVDLRTLSQITQRNSSQKSQWNLRELEGRLVEISDPQPVAALSFAFVLIHEIQTKGHCSAWIGCADSSFYPPDAAACGIDLRCLPILRMKNHHDACRAAETLLRNGAFQFVVIDLIRAGRIHSATQARLHALVKRYQASVLFMTEKSSVDPSIGPLISLRAHTARTHLEQGKFLCTVHAVRDKRSSSSWSWYTSFSGVDGYY